MWQPRHCLAATPVAALAALAALAAVAEVLASWPDLPDALQKAFPSLTLSQCTSHTTVTIDG